MWLPGAIRVRDILAYTAGFCYSISAPMSEERDVDYRGVMVSKRGTAASAMEKKR